MRRPLLLWVTAPMLAISGTACSEGDGSKWAAKANDLCAGVTETWSSAVMDGTDGPERKRLLADMGELAAKLKALAGAGSDAHKAVLGMEDWLAAANSGEVLTDVDWVSAFRDAGAVSCWQLFQGFPSASG